LTKSFAVRLTGSPSEREPATDTLAYGIEARLLATKYLIDAYYCTNKFPAACIRYPRQWRARRPRLEWREIRSIAAIASTLRRTCY